MDLVLELLIRSQMLYLCSNELEVKIFMTNFSDLAPFMELKTKIFYPIFFLFYATKHETPTFHKLVNPSKKAKVVIL